MYSIKDGRLQGKDNWEKFPFFGSSYPYHISAREGVTIVIPLIKLAMKTRRKWMRIHSLDY